MSEEPASSRSQILSASLLLLLLSHCELLTFGDIREKSPNVCVRLIIMELDGTHTHVRTHTQKNVFEKRNTNVFFQTPGYSRKSTGLVVKSLKLQLFSFHAQLFMDERLMLDSAGCKHATALAIFVSLLS